MSRRPSPIQFLSVPDAPPRMRLDRWLAGEFPEHSRSAIQHWIKSGRVTSEGRPLRPGEPLSPGKSLKILLPEAPEISVPEPEEIPLDILHEDEDMLILNKSPGRVVHPAPGHPGGTVLNGILSLYPGVSSAGDPERPGVVHRLDADTSGLLIFARHSESLNQLQILFKSRKVKKIYHALCHGIPDPLSGTIDLPLGRHPAQRKKRAVNGTGARNALSHYTFLKGLAAGTCSLMEVRIETGRTHQIRVHLSHAGHPVLGDRVYGGKRSQLKSPWPAAERVMLHAKVLEFPHPGSGNLFRIEAPYSSDMIHFMDRL